MKIEQLTYFKGENHVKEERVEVAFMSGDGMDWITANVQLLVGGLTKYQTERGFWVDLPPAAQLAMLRIAQTERGKILSSYRVKTYAGWSESGLGSFGDYCTPGDEVDEAMVDYFLEVVPPATFNASLIQCGEPYSHEPDEKGRLRPTFITFERRGGWYYTGECFAGETENRTKTLRGIERAIATLLRLTD